MSNTRDVLAHIVAGLGILPDEFVVSDWSEVITHNRTLPEAIDGRVSITEARTFWSSGVLRIKTSDGKTYEVTVRNRDN